MKYANKKILIISHNPLSRVNNNGKTLVSIFEGVPEKNIYQIYLNTDSPDYSKDSHYLQINEKQIIRSILKMKNYCCNEVEATLGLVSSATIKERNFANHTKRLLRECVWKVALWKSGLKSWLSNKQFDVVFFVAGDGMFAYDVYRFVMQNVSAKSCMFFTDDYIIGKTSYSPAACLRRMLLKRKIRKTLPSVNDLYVISDEMQKAYCKLFGVDSYVIRNFSVEKKETDAEIQSDIQSECLTMVYAGGLHYNRWKVLKQIAKSLKEINDSEKRKCFLKVYSSQNLSNKIVEAINLDGASEFCGSLSASQIAEIYAGADILLHVESFDSNAIASTKYSFSTKIPEYLSAGKCVLAVGPAEVASIRYLSDFACVIHDDTHLTSALKKMILDDDYRNSVQNACTVHYEADFSRAKQKECMEHILCI